MSTPVPGKKFCEISKGMQVIHKNIFQTEFFSLPSVTSQYNLALCKAVRKSIVFLWRIINTLLHSSAGMYIQHTVGNLIKFSSLTSYLNLFSFSVGCKWRMKHEFKYMYLIKIQIVNIQVLMVLGNYWLFLWSMWLFVFLYWQV